MKSSTQSITVRLIAVILCITISVLVYFNAGSLMVSEKKIATDRAQLDMAKISDALELYKKNCRHFPSQERGLYELVKPKECRQLSIGLLNTIPIDPWGEPYDYSIKAGAFRLYTLGADKIDGGIDMNADIYYLSKINQKFKALNSQKPLK